MRSACLHLRRSSTGTFPAVTIVASPFCRTTARCSESPAIGWLCGDSPCSQRVLLSWRTVASGGHRNAARQRGLSPSDLDDRGGSEDRAIGSTVPAVTIATFPIFRSTARCTVSSASDLLCGDSPRSQRVLLSWRTVAAGGRRNAARQRRLSPSDLDDRRV